MSDTEIVYVVLIARGEKHAARIKYEEIYPCVYGVYRNEVSAKAALEAAKKDGDVYEARMERKLVS